MPKKVTLLDQFGNPIISKKKLSGIYQTPYNTNSYGQYAPRITGQPQDYSKELDASTRSTLIAFCRALYEQMPLINGAITQKATWGFGSEWDPIYLGDNKEWGQQVINKWMSSGKYSCNIRGLEFRESLFLTSIELDVSGDAVLILFKDGKFDIYESHRIGQRNSTEKVVTSGPFKGNRIEQGIITDNVGKTVAIRILGEDESKDIDIPRSNAKLIVDRGHLSSIRGNSKISSALFDLMDIQDIDSMLKSKIKIESMMTLIKKNATGTADFASGNVNPFAVDSDENTEVNGLVQRSYAAPAVEYLGKGIIQYIKTDEAIEGFKSSQSPDPNLKEFVKRLEQRTIFAIGWSLDLIAPDLTGPSTRVTKNIANNTVRARQNLIERYARQIFCFWLANAIKSGELPYNTDKKDDPFNWTFTHGEEISIDNSDRTMDIEEYKIGSKSLDDIINKNGRRTEDVRKERQQETDKLLSDVVALYNKYNGMFTPEAILQLQTNQVVPAPTQSTNISTDEKKTTQ